jgi:two-component system sensor histidine kinase BarA
MTRVDSITKPPADSITKPPAMTGSTPEARVALLEAQLKEAIVEIAELRARDALKTQFLANISHDLRTPLTAVITHGEILRDGILGDLTPRQMESVRGIISGGRQLLNQVGEILTYARGAANQLTLVPSRFAIREVLDQVNALNAPLAKKKRLTIAIDAVPDLPPIMADREKIAHVLANLLGNAIEFTPSGGRVWIRASRAPNVEIDSLLVEVGDTGVGIAAEHHDLIFREFAQVDATPSRPHHGTGLGLTIARKLVELHGGRIWVESHLGTGSRFYFMVPLEQPD